MNRIEVTAILKSAIEAGHTPDKLGIFVQTAAGLLDQYGMDAPPQTISSAPAAGASAPAAGDGVQDHGQHTFTLLNKEDKGKFVKVQANAPGLKVQWFSAFGDDANAVRMMPPSCVFTAQVKSKPNPSKPGSSYWNIYKPVVQQQATQTAQQVYPQADDIPF